MDSSIAFAPIVHKLSLVVSQSSVRAGSIWFRQLIPSLLTANNTPCGRRRNWPTISQYLLLLRPNVVCRN